MSRPVIGSGYGEVQQAPDRRQLATQDLRLVIVLDDQGNDDGDEDVRLAPRDARGLPGRGVVLALTYSRTFEAASK